MDFNKLSILINKLASDVTVSPEEVVAELNKNQTLNEDKDTETVDGNIINPEQESQEIEENEEGKLLEKTFPELDVEVAIEKAKENKKLNFSSAPKSIKTASQTYWDILVKNYGRNHSRTNFIKK
jgi:hypothetical protein